MKIIQNTLKCSRHCWNQKIKPDSKKIEPDSDDVDQENYLFKYNIDFIYFSLSLINKYHIHA